MTVHWIPIAALAGECLLAMVIFLLAVVAGRLLYYRGAALAVPFAPGDFSITRYEPMMRLLSEDDFRFLASQPGYRPHIGARLRRARQRIFRMYLRELAFDFQRLHAAALALVAGSPVGSELTGLLIRYQLRFWWRITVIELHLLAPAARVPRFDMSPLLRPMELMQIYVSEA